MARLYLLRHAKSSSNDADLADHDRPLAPRGRRATQAMADHIRERGISPELVLCSSAARAQETLDGIRTGFAEAPAVEIERAVYDGSEEVLLDRLRAVPAGVGSVMLVGHNPAIERLALNLARGGADLERLAAKYPAGALATLELDGDWSQLAPGEAELAEFTIPRELE
jgi:phosphohistidine phosphatase